jgi:N utilization substance protein A
VTSRDAQIDPIGACIGQRGTRIQTIIAELAGEKIDVIEWNENPAEFLRNTLAPAKVLNVDLNEEERVANVLVSPDQLSLAIGRGGQNVRLASRLSGWKINIQEDRTEAAPAAEATPEEVPADVQTE